MPSGTDTGYVSREELDDMRSEVRRKLGHIVQHGMAATGMGQLELASRLDVTQPTVSNWVSGKCAVGPEYWCTLAAIFDIEWSDFFEPYLEMEEKRLEQWF